MQSLTRWSPHPSTSSPSLLLSFQPLYFPLSMDAVEQETMPLRLFLNLTLVTIIFLFQDMENKLGQNWILLIHQLPQKPTNLRVRTWRKLQKLGAVAIKNSVYVLPFNEKTHEDFQWLKREIEAAGGEATVFRAGAVEGATDDEIVTAFRKERDEGYTQLTADLEGLAGAIREQKRGGHLSAGRIRHHETELERLHAELERIVATDFFGA